MLKQSINMSVLISVCKNTYHATSLINIANILNRPRNSCPEVFCKSAALLKKRLWHMCFPVKEHLFYRSSAAAGSIDLL